MKCLSCGQVLKDNGEANKHLTLRRRYRAGKVVEVTPICNVTGRPG